MMRALRGGLRTGMRARRMLSSGRATEATFVPPKTEELVQNYEREARKRDLELKESHNTMASSFPSHSLGQGGETDLNTDTIYRKRLIYRASQRGWLEVDLLLGSYAAKHVMSMSEEDLPHFERIMEQETLDIYNYIIGTDELTPELDNPVMHSIRAYAQANPVGKASIEEYEKIKKDMSN